MTFPIADINYDCRFYTGYKPCNKNDTCRDCPEYQPQGARILIVKLASAGDVLRTACILPGLKKAFPQSAITWVTLDSAKCLLEQHPLIDRLLLFSAETLALCQAEHFDLLLNFEKEPAACALAMLARAKTKKGFGLSDCGTLTAFDADAHYALQLGLDDELKFKLNRKTYPRIIYEMAGLDYAGEQYELQLTAGEKKAADKFRARFAKKKKIHWIAIHTGCGPVFATKQWTPQGFAALIEQLLELKPARVVLFGGPLEREFNRRLLEQFDERVLDGGCDNTLREFAAKLDACDLLVSADTLAMHVAIALKKQTVNFFGPTSAAEIELFGRGEKIVTDFPCAPCYLKKCPLETTCMDALDAATVFQAVQNRLQYIISRQD